MCSIGEDDFGDEGGVHAMVPDLKRTHEDPEEDNVLCNKCKNPEAFYKLQFREAECKECFLHYTRHKFRAALGSSKVLPKNANVVLVFDGSAQSVVLLDMLHHAQTQNTFKRLHCNATVLYVDDYQLIHGKESGDEDYRKFMWDIQTFLYKYSSFESYVMPLVVELEAANCIFNFKSLTEEYFAETREDQQAFIKSMDTIKSLTSRQDFVKHHRRKLVAVAAKHFKCQFAFMSDISMDLAADLLSAIALGRGGSAALDVALVDDRLGADIQIVRPLKDLSCNEIELYVKAQNIHLLQYKCYGECVGSSASLQNLTKSFVDDLQKNYSSTVSTVFRTGSKISANQKLDLQVESLVLNDSDKFEEPIHCSYCNSLLDYRDSTTLLAIEFSRIVSESGSALENINKLNEKAYQNVEGTNERPYIKKLCHACRNISADSPNEQMLF